MLDRNNLVAVLAAKQDGDWLDDSKSPLLRGIYELDGDKLQYCFAQPGADRPDKFEAAKGSKHTLVQLKRFSTGEKPIVDELKAAGVQVQEDEIGWIQSLYFPKGSRPIKPLLAKAAALKKLSIISIGEMDLTSDEFRQLSRIASLQQLILANEKHSVSGLDAFKPSSPLTRLVLNGTAINDQVVEAATIEGLIELSVIKTSLSTASLAKFIESHPDLKRVEFTDVQLDSKVMTALTKLKRLNFFRVNDTNFGDEEAEVVGKVKSLNSLLILNSDLSDAGLEKLTTLKELTFLRLGGTQVTDDGLRLIGSSFPNLRTLYLWGKGNQFTNDGIRELVNHPALEQLHATEPVDDQVVRDTVKELRRWHRERDKNANSRNRPNKQ